MAILEDLEKSARNHPRVAGKKIRIDNVLIGKSVYTMKDVDKVFDDMNFCLILLENGYGFSYFQEGPAQDFTKLVNRNLLEVLEEPLPRYVRISLLDALYSIINEGESVQSLRGNLRAKATRRARILLRDIPRGSKVLLLGAAMEIMEEAQKRKLRVTILELEPQKIGITLAGTTVQDAAYAALEVACKNTDHIIATGMIFVTGSEERVFAAARENRVKLHLYMESGANYGGQLLKYGAETVLAERFPFYDFYGNTKYKRFTKVRPLLLGRQKSISSPTLSAK